MAIKQGKTFKVIEQAHDGSGCGTVLASFRDVDDAAVKRDELARENPGTRYYVAEILSGAYVDSTGGTVVRNYE